MAKKEDVCVALTHPEPEVMQGGDHSFPVPKSSGLTLPEIFARIAARSIKWMEKYGHDGKSSASD